MKVAVIGATGLVGRKITELLQERDFAVSQLIPAASKASAGKQILWKGEHVKVVTIEEALSKKPHFALFSAGADVSGIWAPLFAKEKCRVIDNSSRWRNDPNVKLIVPEVNGNSLDGNDFLVSNPNCSTIQLVVALNLLHQAFRIKRIVVSTYQSVTGSGIKGIAQLNSEREGKIPDNRAYAWPIDKNLIPQIDLFTQNDYTKEEMKMVNETRKIFNDHSLAISATTVRVPVEGGHSESVNAEFHSRPDMEKVSNLLNLSPGVKLVSLSNNPPYPMPLHCQGSDTVFVGRVREDLSCENAINMWVVADNLRKGAATNAVQIAELFVKNF
jgi:aspartate-semialdehyde dehydrogenase